MLPLIPLGAGLVKLGGAALAGMGISRVLDTADNFSPAASSSGKTDVKNQINTRINPVFALIAGIGVYMLFFRKRGRF